MAVTNGDFESGDLTGWSDDSSGGGNYVATVSVVTDAKRSGTYGGVLYAYADVAAWAEARVSQEIDTDFFSLGLYWKIDAVGGTGNFRITITALNSSEEEFELILYNNSSLAPGSFTEFSITMSSIESLFDPGDHFGATTILAIRNRIENYDPSEYENFIFIDDVGVTESGFVSTSLQGKTTIILQTILLGKTSLSFVSTSLQGKTSLLLQTILQGKISLRTETTLQGKISIVLATELRSKISLRTETTLQGKISIVLATELRSKTSLLYLYELSSLIKSGHVIADITEKMIEGTFEFDGATVGGVFSGNYWKHVEFRIPDYAAVQQPVFVGFFPSSQTQYRDALTNETLKAYSFEWYLSQNPLNDADLVLLTPDHQGDITKYQLQFDFQEHYFQVGDVVIGGTTGDTGRIIEVIYGVFDAIIMENPTGIFQDDEQLLVGGVLYAYADGHAVDVTGTVTTVYPEDWIKRVLGGDDWDPLFGLEPHRIASTALIWGVTKPAIDIVFRDEQSIYEAIEDPTQYLEFIFFPGWRDVAGYQQPCVYWVPGTDIDDPTDGLDLPTPVTITSPDGYLVSIDIDQKGEGSVNRVIVRCRLLNGTWYSKTITSSGVDDKTERWRTYRETAKNFATAAECDTRAQDVFDYYNMQTITWKVVFLLRSDFRRLQKLIFSGFGAKLPDDTYRILRIEYDYADGGCTNTQTCTIIRESAFLTYMSLNRSFTASIKEIQAIARAEDEKYGLPEIGTVSTVDGLGGAMYESEQGQLKPGIDANP